MEEEKEGGAFGFIAEIPSFIGNEGGKEWVGGFTTMLTRDAEGGREYAFGVACAGCNWLKDGDLENSGWLCNAPQMILDCD